MNQKYLFCEGCFPNTAANFVDNFHNLSDSKWLVLSTDEYLRSDSVDVIFCSDEHDAESSWTALATRDRS